MPGNFYIFITISAVKKRRCSYKNQVTVVVSGSIKPDFQTEAEETLKFSTFSKVSNNPISFLNSRPNLVASQISKYIMDNLQPIFKTVLKSELPIASSQYEENFEDYPKQALESMAPRIYKIRFHINNYYFIK